MKLSSLSVRNIRRSLRDYTIYFITLILGVAIFYIFNAINTQVALLQLQSDAEDIVELLTNLISVFSVFVAFVLGFLIVYASRFLIRRRNQEFALYMILGMRKGTIARILSLETLIIGVLSLGAGLCLGIGLSQIMSMVVAQMFEADMTKFAFTFSVDACLKTVFYFAIILVVVAIFDLLIVGKSKLINLMQMGSRAEKVRMKNPVLCIVIFLLGAGILVVDYHTVLTRFTEVMNDFTSLVVVLAAGSVATFLVFWSVSGLFLGVISSAKRVYLKGINSFTFRQVSSRVNTMVASMTVICLMLFFTITILVTALSLRDSLNHNIQRMAPVDIELVKTIPDQETREEHLKYDKTPAEEGLDMDAREAFLEESFDMDVWEAFAAVGIDPAEYLQEYASGSIFGTAQVTTRDTLGDTLQDAAIPFAPALLDVREDIMGISDYNQLAQLFDEETYILEEGTYIMLCDYPANQEIRNAALAAGTSITINGTTLLPQYPEVREGFVRMSQYHTNTGTILVPDEVAQQAIASRAEDDSLRVRTYISGNYKAQDKEGSEETEKILLAAQAAYQEQYHWFMNINTGREVRVASVSLGAIVTFLGLYLGLVFLIAGAAILALKALSDSIDSMGRYEMLRRIGTKEKSIHGSLLRQEGILFALPLILACVHSIFGIGAATIFLKSLGTMPMVSSMVITAVIILLIYGGYFLITYFSSRTIIRERKMG